MTSFIIVEEKDESGRSFRDGEMQIRCLWVFMSSQVLERARLHGRGGWIDPNYPEYRDQCWYLYQSNTSRIGPLLLTITSIFIVSSTFKQQKLSQSTLETGIYIPVVQKAQFQDT